VQSKLGADNQMDSAQLEKKGWHRKKPGQTGPAAKKTKHPLDQEKTSPAQNFQSGTHTRRKLLKVISHP
jgi:hypothetical protein